MKPNLEVKIGKLKLTNPVLVASGTFGYGEEFKDFMDLKKLGAIVTKTITVKPRQGNRPPRTCETPAGLLNSIGLENPGIDKFIEEKLPALKKIGVPIIVSIASEGDPQEFAELVKRLDKIKEISAVELNISCPNIHNKNYSLSVKEIVKNRDCFGPSGLAMTPFQLISQDSRATYEVVKMVRKVTGKTLITKLSPNVTSISDIALAAEKAGSDAVALINTLMGMVIDVNKRKPKIAQGVGGLSGPAIRPVAIKMIWETYQKIKIPIIGMGGIMNTQNALEFFLAGASAVSVGTVNFINPKATVEIIDGLEEYLIDHKINDIKELIGGLKV